VRKSNRLGALPTLDRFPARREGIHLPQTRAQISAKAEAVRTKILEDEAVKANLEASQREELQSLMADKISTMQPVPIDVPSSPEHMEVDKEEAEQEAIKDAIINVASSDVEDALPRHLPLPPPDTAAKAGETKDNGYSPSPECVDSSDSDNNCFPLAETDTESTQPVASETAQKRRLPSKTNVCCQ
jgi:hypothetical protein